jgi:perosamine synthetase
MPGVAFVDEPEHAESNFWLNTLLLDEEDEGRRDEVLELTNRSGIQTRPAWTPMHRLPMYAACPRANLGVAESLARRLISLPSSAILGEAHAAT